MDTVVRQQDLRHRAVLTRLEATPGPVTVHCRHASPPATGTRSVRLEGCLLQEPSYRLVDLARSAGHAALVVGECREAASDARLQGLAALLGPEVLTIVTTARPAPGQALDLARPPFDRRQALGLAPAATATNGHHEAGDDHQRLLESLLDLPLADPHQPSSVPRLEATGCIACGVCTRACPHGALQITQHDSMALLQHRTDRCRAEGACIELCPVGAIRTAGPLDWGALFDEPVRLLAHEPVTTCRRCGDRIVDDGGDMCGPCHRRAQRPMAVNLPVEVLERLGRDPSGRRRPAPASETRNVRTETDARPS